jgi:hypothetical protein
LNFKKGYSKIIRDGFLNAKHPVGKLINSAIINDLKKAHEEIFNEVFSEKFSGESFEKIKNSYYDIDKKEFNSIIGAFDKEGLGELTKEYERKVISELNVDLSLFNNNFNVFKGFCEIVDNYQNFTSKIMFSTFTYNTMGECVDLSNDFIKSLGEALIKVQTQPEKSIIELRKKEKEYTKAVKSLY